MLETDYTFNLNETVSSGHVSVGLFDGKHPSIAAVTRSDKVFVHNPHNRSNYPTSTPPIQNDDNQPRTIRDTLYNVHTDDLQFFQLNQTISCIGTGKISARDTVNNSGENKNDSANILDRSRSRDRRRNISMLRKQSIKDKMFRHNNIDNEVLVIGTKTSVHVYDILQNCDLFYKEIPDGANTIVIGRYGDICDGNIMLVGGNCAIHGFDRAGNDVYWTVTGDNITAMALVDFDNDGLNELVVGSEDYEIQVFKNDAILFETTESDKIVHLVSLGPGMFGYGLANGTVGVYQANGERLWRIKSKNTPTYLFGLDVNLDGQMELITGWSNGKLDIRNLQTGEVYYRENFKSSVAGILKADYNMDGKEELIVVNISGEVSGLKLVSKDQRKQRNDTNFEQETIRDLMRRKQTLIQELRNYEESQKVHNDSNNAPIIMSKGKMFNNNGSTYGAIPANTKIKSSLLLKFSQNYSNQQGDFDEEKDNGCIELILETTNDTQIRAAALFAEGVFKNESHVVCCPEELATNNIRVELRPIKDMKIDLHIKALVGYRSSNHFHVFELARHLPRFAMYAFVSNISLVDKLTKSLLGMDSLNDTDIYHIDSSTELYSEETIKELKLNKSNSSESKVDTPKSFVKFHFVDQFSKIIEWINMNFLLDRELEPNEMDRRVEFVSMRDKKPLVIEFRKNKAPLDSKNKNDDNGISGKKQKHTRKQLSTESEDFENIEVLNRIAIMEQMAEYSSQLTIFTDSMELAGNIVQSLLSDFLAIPNLACLQVHYPDDIERLRELIDRVEDIQNIRQHLLAEVADSGNLIRSTVVQCEDARLIEDYTRMKQIHNDLALMNREIMREHTIRVQNHKDLVDSLKEINIIIQRASNLRIGTFKTALITSCRAAIKDKYFNQLYKIICEEVN